MNQDGRAGRLWHVALLLAGLMSLQQTVQAECREDSGWGGADHALVNGFLNRAVPEVHFLVPGDVVGNGTVITPYSTVAAGGGGTPPNHVRFRQQVKRNTRTIAMQVDSSGVLQCTNCSTTASIPLSKLSWTVDPGTSSGSAVPTNGRFNNSVQTWITSQPGDDSTFNLQFDFMNDTIYPAGTYEGVFLTRGVPQ
ncbi:MAG: hypothetical protein KDI15_06685 [Thiothrix sp.]|nr:hypothetical protein [Thiothrix sp.]